MLNKTYLKKIKDLNEQYSIEQLIQIQNNFLEYKEKFLINVLQVININFSYSGFLIEQNKIDIIKKQNKKWQLFCSEFKDKINREEIDKYLLISTERVFYFFNKKDKKKFDQKLISYINELYVKYKESHNKIVESNIYFMYKVVNKLYRIKNSFLDINDVFQDLMHYLLTIIHKYNPNKNNPIRKYIFYRIKYLIRDVIYKYKIPLNMSKKTYYKICQIRDDIEYNQKDYDYICEKYKVSKKTILKYLTIYNNFIKDPQLRYLNDLDLDCKLIFNNDIINFLQNKKIKKVLVEILKSIGFTKQNLEIIKMRYGLNKDGVEYTFQEIGDRFGITRQRVQQIDLIFLNSIKSRKIFKYNLGLFNE